jgi:hypothetical protein
MKIMATIPLLNQPFPLCGVGTLTFTIPTTGSYFVAVQLTEVPVTGLSVVVNNNGTPIYTAPTITPTQSAQQFKTSFLANTADVITVVVSSSTPIDLLLNTVKSVITIGQGM